MAKRKNFLKTLISPLALSILKTNKFKSADKEAVGEWAGNYSSWEAATAKCSGYNADNILEICKISLLRIKNGEAIYERDSVLFDEIQYSWGLLAGLQRAGLENDRRLCVLDFGGSLGSTYYQNKSFLNTLKVLQWCIVEQGNFVDCGKANFENSQLKFYHNIDECLSECKPNVLILSSVLQYLEKPYEWVEKFVSLGIKNIIIDRTAFVEGEEDILTIQKVPESIYQASYPAWFFGSVFLDGFLKNYTALASFDNGFTTATVVNSISKVYWKGYIMALKK